MLWEGGGPTFGLERYGAAYNSIVTDDNSSHAEIIVQYAECATIAESKVSMLEDWIATMEMKQQTTYPQTAYYAQIVQPEYAYFTPFQPPTFILPPAVQVPAASHATTPTAPSAMEQSRRQPPT